MRSAAVRQRAAVAAAAVIHSGRKKRRRSSCWVLWLTGEEEEVVGCYVTQHQPLLLLLTPSEMKFSGPLPSLTTLIMSTNAADEYSLTPFKAVD